MFSAAKTFSFLFKDFRKSFIHYKPLGFFSSCSRSLSFINQNNCTRPLFTQDSLSKTLLQATTNNLSLSRSVTKYSLKTGKKKTVYPVLLRFFRLHNGLWIRRRAGCHKRIHKRNTETRYNFAQHVVCTKTQCMMFDQMITDHHKKRKYYIDDPFEPYHDRHNLDWVLPRRKT